MSWASSPSQMVGTGRGGRAVRGQVTGTEDPLTEVSCREGHRHLGFLLSVHVCSIFIKEVKSL